MKKIHVLAGMAAVIVAAKLIERRRRWLPLKGRTIVIAGGSRGLAFVLAQELLRKGNRLALLAREKDELDRAAQKLPQQSNILTVACDVTNKEQVDTAFAEVEARFGAIDVLINNAGTMIVGPLECMSEGDYEKSLAVSFWGPFHTIHAVLPIMRKQGGGRIVNISSIGGKISVPHMLPYSVGKFALAGLSEGLRAELSKENILVTTIYPGLMRTGSPRNASFKGKHRHEYAWFSLSDSLPGLSISAERAARQIIKACEAGSARRIISLPAKVAIKVHELLPELTASFLSYANRLLPGEGGIGKEQLSGKESRSFVSPSPLTTLTERAALRNNEVA